MHTCKKEAEGPDETEEGEEAMPETLPDGMDEAEGGDEAEEGGDKAEMDEAEADGAEAMETGDDKVIRSLGH